MSNFKKCNQALLLLFLSLFAVTKSYANTTQGQAILQTQDSNVNLYLSGESAENMYQLISKGLKMEKLPNGSVLRGSNATCMRTFSERNSLVYFCSIAISHKGVLENAVSAFDPDNQHETAKITQKSISNQGSILLTFSGESINSLYSSLSVEENAENRKIASNILCEFKAKEKACHFLINQRGIADFPEELLK